MDILFVTDLHGSEACLENFLTAMGQPNGPDVGIVGGDIAGMNVYPFIKREEGGYLGPDMSYMPTEEALNYRMRQMADRGDFSFVTTLADYKRYAEGDGAAQEVIDMQHRLMAERLHNWVEAADDVVQKTGRKIVMSVGNDDPLYLDSVIRDARHVAFSEDRAIDLGENTTLFSVGYSNETPWKTPRECPEWELAQRIDTCLNNKPSGTTCVFNFHRPPHRSKLDKSPDGHVGSKAVRNALEVYSPALALFGHIHESMAIQKLGVTTCINPGSDYERARLSGARILVENGRVVDAMLTREQGQSFSRRKKLFGFYF